MINILNPDGTINENGGKYQGMDRYQAREEVTKEMENLGFFQGREDRDIPLALSDRIGHAKFYIQKGAVSWNSSFFDNFASQHGRDEIEQIEVNMTTLDAYATDQALKPAFIKIDAEGSEFLILRGAMKTIQKHNPFISMEFNPESARTANTSVEEMQKVLENAGYQLVVLRRLRTGSYRFDRQEPFQPDKHCAGDLCNVLCIPSRLCRAWRHGREFQPVGGHAVLSAGAYQVSPEICG